MRTLSLVTGCRHSSLVVALLLADCGGGVYLTDISEVHYTLGVINKGVL
jgi:hypothetical protein